MKHVFWPTLLVVGLVSGCAPRGSPRDPRVQVVSSKDRLIYRQLLTHLVPPTVSGPASERRVLCIGVAGRDPSKGLLENLRRPYGSGRLVEPASRCARNQSECMQSLMTGLPARKLGFGRVRWKGPRRVAVAVDYYMCPDSSGRDVYHLLWQKTVWIVIRRERASGAQKGPGFSD